MAELKTQKNSASVTKFIDSVDDEQKRADAYELVKIFSEVTGEKPMMWGDSIIGFGEYHYKSDRSTQEGNWMLTGFSPRKQQISLYIMSGFKEHSEILKEIGKHKLSKGCCLYIKRLSDINIKVLKKLIRASVKEVKRIYKVK